MSTEILDQLAVGIIIIDLDEKIRYANANLKSHFLNSGFNPSGKKINDPTMPWYTGLKNPREKLPILKAKLTGNTINEITEIKIKNETVKVVNIAVPLRNPKGILIGAVGLFLNAGLFQPSSSSDEVLQKLYAVLKRFISNNTLSHIVSSLKSAPPPAEKCFVTIAFIDIVGFSTLAETLEPHQTVNVLNLFFGRVHKTIARYKGDIDKYLGDAVLSVFFNAEACVRCCTELLLSDLPVINGQLRKLFPNISDLGVHIGINSGWVILGEVGAAERKEFTVIGDDVNTAARIQSLTPPNEIWISGQTMDKLGEFNRLMKEAEYIKVKGKSAQIKVYKFDPTQIKMDTKVFFYEKNEAYRNTISDALKNRGVTSITHSDSLENAEKVLNPQFESVIIGPGSNANELLSIQKIVQKAGMGNEVLIPVSKDTDPKTIEALEKRGIKTYVPLTEGKEFETNLENIIKSQKINKIPMKKELNETDSFVHSRLLKREDPEKMRTETEEPGASAREGEESLSNSIIYSKQSDSLMITIMNILNSSQLIQLAGNIRKIWEFDYRSKADLQIVFSLNPKINHHINEEYIVKIIESIFKFSQMQEKGWTKGFAVIKTEGKDISDIIKKYEEEYRIKTETA
ncbi:MAG TPA: adenylate/guanylate cyclase domain-containing protein [Leptospiraceae bacterium]|nr:adenylate/guanylate cyclase domain-containing protein [Leptospiraceae bacterium]